MSPRATDPAEPPGSPAGQPTQARDTRTSRRLLIVDGDHRVRDGIAGLMALSAGVQVVGMTSRPHETLDAVRRLRPGVIVVDPMLPDLDSGLALISALRAYAPSLRIVATCRDGGLDHAALAAGADACVERCGDPAAFHDAILAAVLSPTVLRRRGPARTARRADDDAGSSDRRRASRSTSTDAVIE